MEKLKKLRAAVIATDGVEEFEITKPVEALKSSGADVVILCPKPSPKGIQAFRHHDKTITIDVDEPLGKASPGSYDALLLPGGALSADALRAERDVLEFIRGIEGAGKPIAAICHAPWELVSAGLVRGRRLTSYHTIQDDIRNAGGEWIDEEVVADRNWVTSRKPSDIPAFNKAMLILFSASYPRRAPAMTAQPGGAIQLPQSHDVHYE